MREIGSYLKKEGKGETHEDQGTKLVLQYCEGPIVSEHPRGNEDL